MKKFKYTKFFKYKGSNFNKLHYGTWALKATSYGIISKKYYIFIKQLLQKISKKFKFNIIYNKNISKKALETRMGGGKGLIYEEQYFVKPGTVFLEFYNISSDAIFSVSKIINNKISLNLKLVNLN